MNTVTYKEFLEFEPCWLKYEDGAERIKAYFDRFGGSMSALDILNLDDVSEVDKLWSVLREEFIPAPTLHEFACVCAEHALSLIETPDPRSIKAIEVKRAWMRGEATGEELDAATAVAWDAYVAAWYAARAAAWDTAKAAAWDAAIDAAKAAAWDTAKAAAWDAAIDAAKAAAWAARETAWNAAWNAARDAARAARETAWNAARAAKEAAREAQVTYLIMALED